MTLSHLLDGVRVSKLFAMQYGKHVLTHDIIVRQVQYDSRLVQRGDLFVAIRGTAVDGHNFVQRAVEAGAVAVVMEDDAAVHDFFFLHTNVVKIVVPDSRSTLARMAANIFGHPSDHLRLIGVTGTNGKTTTTHLIKSVLEAAGETVGLIGTIRYMVGDKDLPSTHTTPESLELQGLLATMREHGCSSVVMEVSSHALAMKRVAGARFAAAVFTNLTQDHLDFHGSMEKYLQAKKALFDNLDASAVAVVNANDPAGTSIVSGTSAARLSFGANADVRASEVSMTMTGMSFQLEWQDGSCPVRSSLTGRFNVANILAASATGIALGVSPAHITSGIAALQSVRGRFEQVVAPAGWVAVIDYAHTPDALEKCLLTIRDVMPSQDQGRIITVFGCGGDRDRGKRPLMGKIASELSDITIVTSDNPRREPPERIIGDIMVGIEKRKEVHVQADRREAIRVGLSMARSGDTVLIAGKGHETYQVIGDVKDHLDDREEVEAFLGGVQSC
jgi:UDP-N-acetylmuramoyl-L-alanyl-D-glutamate--2,6-diaminopimelate ligase